MVTMDTEVITSCRKGTLCPLDMEQLYILILAS